MNLVDLYCGCGGFSLGAHRAGFKVASAYDNDEILTHSFPTNFPETQLFHRDVSTLSGNDIISAVGGEIVGIFGGPPCQGFSEIGRQSTADPRRALLGHFFRLVAEVRPTFFVMENVRGLTYADSLPVLEEALAFVQPHFDILGPTIWDASDFGAATKRNRMFVIGVRKDQRAPISRAAIEAQMRHPATVRAAIADLQDARALPDRVDQPGYDQWEIRCRALPEGYARSLRAEEKVFTGHRPTEHTPAVVERFASVEPGQTDPVGRHPRLKWNGQCPTLRAGTGSDKGSYQAVRPIHPEENRVITVREAARLQGFPDNHLFHPTVWHSFRMIGNSVSPIMSEAIFRAISEHFRLCAALADSSNASSRLTKMSAEAAE